MSHPINPSNEELIILYKARAVVKEQIKNKVEALRR